MKLTTMGICLGASTVTAVEIEIRSAPPAHRIKRHFIRPHEGNPKRTLCELLDDMGVSACDRIAATGRRLRRFVNLTSIPEPEAVEHAYRFVKPAGIRCPAIVSAGGETFIVYVLDANGRISSVSSGNKCASGTGEFFLQQLRRMNVSLDDAARWAASEKPYPVSGRCSVFCKSDCTHATNKGVPKSRVTAGLCKMMAEKILGLLKKIPRKNVMLVGGTARNRMMVTYLRREITGLIVPEEAPYFEALGAAVWAGENLTRPYPGTHRLIKSELPSFETLPPLAAAESRVDFKTMRTGSIRPKDICLLGLDVGSTTTKAVLVRRSDTALLASVYLRTGGDPVGASRKCYRALYEQIRQHIDPADIAITGLGVCGSGRQIAGLHALTDGVINEIMAHAAAAVHFDPAVDTLFEIGGQDAKYTIIRNGVPADYAMNEACSAGTGSFLEESAHESLGVKMEDIAEVAVGGLHPPNFNDQCAAFIASDIKNAIHEGVAHRDIVAGLVYSICMNYMNRVKGNRPVGRKVFMQGGVCYNRAVPLAMANLVEKPIVVPPEPGLMGAFGAALEIRRRIDAGQMPEKRFDLAELARRRVTYGPTFTCRGGREKCDRRYEIAVIEIEGKKYPFGGACNRYYNLRHEISHDMGKLDRVDSRHRMVFETRLPEPGGTNTGKCRGTIGFNRSFLVNTYYPLYAGFFSALGFQPVLPAHPDQEGIDQRNAPLCYPGELAHGFFHSLIFSDPPPDFLFLPHFRAVPDKMKDGHSQVCPLVQGETFYLRSTFRDRLEALEARGTRVLTPLIDLTEGIAAAGSALVATARGMGIGRAAARAAFQTAMALQRQFSRRLKAMGARALAMLEEDPDATAVVLFGRPYNAFVPEAHMGIPRKFASRGVPVIPFDCLDVDAEQAKRHMFWGMGQRILKAARYVKKHPRLFGTFITNFSCGPDSFIIGYFRDIMGRKPSLTLELDSHTADAGLETRIEAYLDIIHAYRHTGRKKTVSASPVGFRPARTVLADGRIHVITSSGEQLPLTDPRVTLLLPSMGRLTSEALAAVFRGLGYHALAHRPSDASVLKLGRGNSSCKECLPLILTTGTLLDHVRNEKRDGEVLVYFFASGSGPCRFGQYRIFMEDLVARQKIPDVAVFSLTPENAYMGLADGFDRKGWWAITIADVMEDLRSMLLASAENRSHAETVFESRWQDILDLLAGNPDFSTLQHGLRDTALHLGRIALKRPPEMVPKILITGEIFVRRDALSRQYLTERLADMGFAAICSPIIEWLKYCTFMARKSSNGMSAADRVKLQLRRYFQYRYEKKIKAALSESGLIDPAPVDIDSILACAAPLISSDLAGEAVLTVGSALHEIVQTVCGVIAIGPFGCMPNRLSEALLANNMNRRVKLSVSPESCTARMLRDTDALPFLAIESDGSPFPQLITARLEAFCLQAQRLHKTLQNGYSGQQAGHHSQNGWK